MSTLISRDILENELARFQDKSTAGDKTLTELHSKHIASYRTFIRFNVIKQKKSQVLEDFIFSALGKHLCENKTISYESFKIVSSMAPVKARKYFSAKNFLLFPKDANQCIESEDFVKFIERSMEIENTVLNLMEFTPAGPIGDPYTTTVSEQQLNSYLFRLINEIDVGGKMHESFYEYYVYTASQKFTFFLDSRRTNLMPIKKLAHSGVMEELLYLRRLSHNYYSQLSTNNTPEDDDMNMSLAMEFETMSASNWFSGGNAVKIYSLFLELDKDQNGMLSIDEMRHFQGLGSDQIQFTTVAMQRLFEEYITYQPYEMDYKGFVNLVLACENITSSEAIKFFWRVLDHDRSDRLNADKIKLFYRDIYDSLSATGYDAPNPNHVVLEVFDLVSCNDERGPTLKDLVDSKQGHTVITMLLDINGFWRYDNRESLMAHPSNDDEEEKQQQQQQQSAPAPAPSPVSVTVPATSENSRSSLLSKLNEDYDDEDFENFDDF